ncbi:hypothetical protein BGW80DRAFT_1537245 [Lactifluus volemus]|nr:hypothetical protein BGW80DRAFT_1537245 [Lactifluus volemus]
MVLDGPILALSDIMHGIAPSPDTPIPQEDDVEKIHRAESLTPEPLDYAQIELMRKRVLELIVSGASKMNTSSREKELVEMVIRLTSVRTPEPDANQLYSQAKTIEELCRQRDFIMKGVEEERARWEAERLGFDRVTEALIGSRSHGRDHQSTYREEVRSSLYSFYFMNTTLY